MQRNILIINIFYLTGSFIDLEEFDESFVTESGKCHCCGEDLETAHSVCFLNCFVPILVINHNLY